METTIILKEIQEKAGKTKTGKPYTLYTLIDEFGRKHTIFNTFDKANIKPGDHIRLYENPTEFKTRFNIERIIDHYTPTPPDSLDPGAPSVKNTQAGKGAPTTTPALPALTAELQASWIRQADEALEKAGADKDIEAGLEVELVRQYFSQWMSDRIALEQKLRWAK